MMNGTTVFSARAGLVALGVKFRHMKIWDMIAESVTIKQKVRQHTPLNKLLDCFINILAGGAGVVEINTRVRPDIAVQRAFGRSTCAEQSTISDTLNACTPDNVVQMRSALKSIMRAQSQSYHHDYQTGGLVLDVDVTGLVAGRQGEGVTKGYFPNQKNRRGRQLGRVIAARYDELVFERLYDGKRQLDRSFQDLMSGAEDVLNLAENLRKMTIIRSDAGGGTDANLNWVLSRDYQVLIKVKNWRRAEKLAASVHTWHSDPKVAGREVGWVMQPHAYVRPTRQLALRERKRNGQWSYHVIVLTLTDAMLFELCDQTAPTLAAPLDVLLAALHAYDRRGGGAETQNRNDKQGLHLMHRNKHKFAAQEMLVLLAQLAHNLVIWTRNDLAHRVPQFKKYGVLRTVRDVFQIPGDIQFDVVDNIQLITLNDHHPCAATLCRAFASDELSLILGKN
jgi:hypothetical protein